MSSARGAAKALQVEHFGLGSHHKIVFGENILAGRAAGGVKPKIGKLIQKIVLMNKSFEKRDVNKVIPFMCLRLIEIYLLK